MQRQNMAKASWERVHWTVTDDETIFDITTEGGMTWALRALLAAGSSGLHPIETGEGRWARMVSQLRESGVTISDIEPDQLSRAGYALTCQVKRAQKAVA